MHHIEHMATESKQAWHCMQSTQTRTKCKCLKCSVGVCFDPHLMPYPHQIAFMRLINTTLEKAYHTPHLWCFKCECLVEITRI